MQCRSDVECDVQHAPIIAGERGLHELIADQLAVDVQIKEAQTAHEGRGAAERFAFVRGELVAHVAGGQPPVLALPAVAPGNAPRRNARLAKFQRGHPGRIIEADLFPADARLGRRTPLAVGMNHQRRTRFKLHSHRTNPAARIVRHIGLGIGGGDCQLIVTPMQVPRNIDADQVRMPTSDTHLRSID